MSYEPPPAGAGELPFQLKDAEFEPIEAGGLIHYDPRLGQVSDVQERFHVRGTLTTELLGQMAALELEENTCTARQGILGRLDIGSWRSSSKIEALVEELSNLRLQDVTTKSLVFSQFVNFLDLIAFRLQKAGFKVSRTGPDALCITSDCRVAVPPLDLSLGGNDDSPGSRRDHTVF